MSVAVVKGSMMPADDSDGEDSDTGTGHELVAASNLSASSALAGTLRATAMLPIDDDYEDGDEVVEVFGSAVMPAQPPPVPEATQHRRRIPPPQLPSAAELAPAVVSSSQPKDLATTMGKPLSADVFDRAHKPIPVPGASGKAQAPTLEGEAEMLRAARESAAVTGGGSLAVTQHGVAVDGGISVEQDDEFGDIALGDAARGAIAASPTVPATQAVDAMGREKAAARVRAAVAAQADALAQSMAQSAAEDRALAASGAEAAQLAATIVAEADDLGGGFAAGEESSFARHGASSAVAGSTTAGRLVGGALVPMARERGDGDGDVAEAGEKYDPLRAAKASLAGVRGELQLVKEAEAEAERRESLAEARRAVEAATAAGKGGKRGGAIIEEAEEDEEEAEEDEEEEDDDTKVPSSARPSAAAAAVASGSSALPDEDAEADAEFSAATAAYRAAQAAEAAAGHGVAGAVHRAGLTVGFREAQRLLLEAVEPQEAAGTWGMPDVPLQLGSAGGWCCFGGVSLSADSQRARRSLHRIARTAFDADSALHKRVMAAVYSKLCGGDPLSPDWTDVGFQNASQFATDLRGSGMLGPLCMLYFCDEHSSLLKGVWVRDPTDPAAFPFAVISLNATVLALRAMEGKTLHRMAAASSMLQAFMQTYVTIVSEFSARLVAMGGTDAKSSLVREAAEAVIAAADSKVAACMTASSKRSSSLSAAAKAGGGAGPVFGMG